MNTRREDNARHATWEQLVALAAGDTLNDETRRHVAECGSCHESLRSAAHAILSMQISRESAPTSDELNRALRSVAAEASAMRPTAVDRVVEGLSAVASVAREAIETVRATLVANSWTPSAAVRGATTAWPRVLVYETSDHSISLSLCPGDENDRTAIVGQIVPREADGLPAGGHVALLGGDAECREFLSEFGEFRFETAIGATRLDITFGGQTISIDPLPDGHGRAPYAC